MVQVELQVTAIHVVSRSAPLPFEVTDAARSAEAVRKAAEAGKVLVTVGQVRLCAGCWRLRYAALCMLIANQLATMPPPPPLSPLSPLSPLQPLLCRMCGWITVT